MKLVTAETAGFCFGVNRAIKMAKESIEKYHGKKLYSLGPLIHNRQTVEYLKEKGLTIVEDLSKLNEGDVLIIRAHGVPEALCREAEDKKIILVDATCPFVKKIHNNVSEFTKRGCKTIIVGDENHPEVIGIKGWNGNALVIGNEGEAQNIDFDGQACVVAQTTLTKESWENICEILKKKIPGCEFYNTICSATSERQEEAKKIAQNSDIMIVVGDPNSSNSQKLFEICKKFCNNTYFIETVNQIKEEWFKLQKSGDNKQQSRGDKDFNCQLSTVNCQLDLSVGITAGASVPDNIIKEVIDRMSDFEKQNEDELSFAELFEGSIKRIEPEQIIKGKVIRVNEKDIFVDLGYKADGIIPSEEFSDNPDEKPSDLYKAGDEIDVYVVKVNDGEGNVLLSRKRLDYIKGWEKVEEAFKNGSILKGIITEAVNAGVIALVTGIRVFIPASQLSDRPVSDLTQFIKKQVDMKIIDFNRQKKKVIGSCKAVIQKEKEAAKEKLWGIIEIGQELKGTVKRLADFGAFVDIGGMDGLIHISELSWGRIKHPSEVLKEGQEVLVRVIDINREKEKVSLGYRKTLDDPWQASIEKYEIGKVIKGKVVNFMPFGAFVELEQGLTGLVHISQISDKRIGKPQEVLTIGQEVEAKITEIDKEKKKISLSIKDTLAVIESSSKGNVGEELPSEHKEDMSFTLGDAFENKALVKKESSALEKVSDKKALEKVEPKPLVAVEDSKGKK